jgi:hypothetical protein
LSAAGVVAATLSIRKDARRHPLVSKYEAGYKDAARQNYGLAGTDFRYATMVSASFGSMRNCGIGKRSRLPVVQMPVVSNLTNVGIVGGWIAADPWSAERPVGIRLGGHVKEEVSSAATGCGRDFLRCRAGCGTIRTRPRSPRYIFLERRLHHSIFRLGAVGFLCQCRSRFEGRLIQERWRRKTKIKPVERPDVCAALDLMKGLVKARTSSPRC